MFRELNYDLGVTCGRTSEFLATQEKELLPGWVEQTEAVQSRVLDYQDHTVGILVFPRLKGHNTKRGLQKIQRQIVEKAKSMRPGVNILLGISTWGNSRENKFLENSPPVFDILLGSGSGPHVTGNFLNKNQTLWIRPLSKGKTVNRITISQWPEKDKKITWKPNKNIFAKLIALNDDITPDSKISTYLQGD
ncbi:MAG: hypothetical protein ACOCZ2_03775 [Thermodesulfobacteriota bacterium]